MLLIVSPEGAVLGGIVGWPCEWLLKNYGLKEKIVYFVVKYY
jgi:hypothetical protein